MNIFSVLSFTALFIYFYIGTYSYQVYKSSKIRVLFFIFCMAMSVWSFSYIFVYGSPTNSDWWVKLSSIGWCSFNAIILHMVLKFTKPEIIDDSYLRYLLYVPAVFLCITDVFMFEPIHHPSKMVWNFFYYCDYLYNFSYILVSIILIYKWGNSERNRIKKKQSQILLVTSITPFALYFITQTFLPMIGINEVPSINQLFILITMTGIFWASTRYGFFDIPNKFIFDEMLPEMIDILLILDSDGMIVNTNEKTLKLLGYNREELIDTGIKDIIVNRDEATILMLLGNNSHKKIELDLVKKSGEIIPVALTCSAIFAKNSSDILGIVITGQDISTQKALKQEIIIQMEIEEELRESEERFRAIFAKHDAMMLLIEPDTLRIFLANEAAQRFYGYSEEQLKGLAITELNELKDIDAKNIINAIFENRQKVLNLKHRLASGELRDVEIHSSFISFSKKKLIFSIVHDITERKREEEYILHLAYHDGLTDLYNHKFFYERMREEVVRAKRYKSKFGVIYMDMDKFKDINDNYGHDYGDIVLIETGKRILKCIRKSDIAARIGGDEFAIIMLGVKNEREINVVIKKLLEEFKRPIAIEKTEFLLQASVGSSIYPDDGASADHLIKTADKAMYNMKKHRRNEYMQK